MSARSDDGLTYAVLGCGRQGTAAALDLARLGRADRILLADADAESAEVLGERLRGWLPADELPELEVLRVDASHGEEVRTALEPADATVAAVPYRFLLDVTEAAIAAGTHACDLGGHPETVREQLELDARARDAGVAVVPDCGQAPGMATTLTMLALGMVDEPDVVELWDGGLPVDPEPPLYYRLTFDIRGLTNEYDGPAWAVRDGEPVALDALEERQEVDFPPPLGRLEAFTASGTGSTLPWSLEGRVREFTSRIVRHPGHLDAVRTLRELGLFRLAPVEVEEAGSGDPVEVRPRRVTEAVLEPSLTGDGPVDDVVVVRAHCTGRTAGERVRAEVDLMTFADPETGLTAMQRCTGFDAAIVAAMAAGGGRGAGDLGAGAVGGSRQLRPGAGAPGHRGREAGGSAGVTGRPRRTGGTRHGATQFPSSPTRVVRAAGSRLSTTGRSTLEALPSRCHTVWRARASESSSATGAPVFGLGS